MQVILSALRPQLCNSTRPQHTLQMFADHCGPRQTIPWETINQGLLQPQGELYHIQTIFNHRSRDQLEFCTSFYETISSEFLVQGSFKHTQFSREHWYRRDLNSQPLTPKASAVSIELTWLSQSEQICKWGIKFAHWVTTDHLGSTSAHHYPHTKYFVTVAHTEYLPLLLSANKNRYANEVLHMHIRWWQTKLVILLPNTTQGTKYFVTVAQTEIWIFAFVVISQ